MPLQLPKRPEGQEYSPRKTQQDEPSSSFTYVDVTAEDEEERRIMDKMTTNSMSQQLWHKIKSNPVITGGFLGMCVLLGCMVRYRDDKVKLNRLARWRLNLSFLTLSATLYAMYKDEAKTRPSPYPWEWSARPSTIDQVVVPPST